MPNFKEIMSYDIFSKQLSVGFDPGDSTMKFALVNPKKRRIEALYEEPTFPERETKDQEIEREKLRQRIASFYEKLSKKESNLQKQVYTIVQGESTTSNYIELPPLSKKEIETAVNSRALKFIPFHPDKVKLDFVEVPPLNEDEKKTAVFYVAAHKDKLEEFKTFLKGCNLEALSIETPELPLSREFSENHDINSDNFFIIVNVGFKFTRVLILRKGYPYYSREFSLAGKDFTYAIQMAEQISWAKAEKKKMKYDVSERNPAIEPFISRWLNELERSISFFKRQNHSINITYEKIYLSGGSANLKNFDLLISEHLEIPTVVDKWDRLRYKGKSEVKNPNAFKTAVGLTLVD